VEIFSDWVTSRGADCEDYKTHQRTIFEWMIRWYSDPVATIWSISFQTIDARNNLAMKRSLVILYRPRWSGLAFLNMESDDFSEETQIILKPRQVRIISIHLYANFHITTTSRILIRIVGHPCSHLMRDKVADRWQRSEMLRPKDRSLLL